MIVSLEETKMYLRVDGDDENALITNFILVSEEICEGILRCPLSGFTDIPQAIKHAVLYAVANMYEHREDLDMKAVSEMLTRLLFSYRKESW